MLSHFELTLTETGENSSQPQKIDSGTITNAQRMIKPAYVEMLAHHDAHAVQFTYEESDLGMKQYIAVRFDHQSDATMFYNVLNKILRGPFFADNWAQRGSLWSVVEPVKKLCSGMETSAMSGVATRTAGGGIASAGIAAAAAPMVAGAMQGNNYDTLSPPPLYLPVEPIIAGAYQEVAVPSHSGASPQRSLISRDQRKRFARIKRSNNGIRSEGGHLVADVGIEVANQVAGVAGGQTTVAEGVRGAAAAVADAVGGALTSGQSEDQKKECVGRQSLRQWERVYKEHENDDLSEDGAWKYISATAAAQQRWLSASSESAKCTDGTLGKVLYLSPEGALSKMEESFADDPDVPEEQARQLLKTLEGSQGATMHLAGRWDEEESEYKPATLAWEADERRIEAHSVEQNYNAGSPDTEEAQEGVASAADLTDENAGAPSPTADGGKQDRVVSK